MAEKPAVLVVFGTRPEAIKMAPVVFALRKRTDLHTVVCVTGQHREMLDQVLDCFAIRPDHDLNLMKPAQSLCELMAVALTGLTGVIEQEKPAIVLVHGDTTTTLAASLAAYHHRVLVGHVEAGLRTGKKYAPFPEEMNRKLTDALCDFHYAPTEAARQNLLYEGVEPSRIAVTGNTAVDALLHVEAQVGPADLEQNEQTRGLLGKKVILVTGHRRENFGPGIRRICEALKRIAERNPTAEIVYPVHLNPQIQGPVQEILGGVENVRLISPLDYRSFVALMKASYLILTDSGGIQEEAPSLHKPVLVMREVTERPELVKAGGARLVGDDSERIVNASEALLNDPAMYGRMSAVLNPFGDGRAAERIADHLKEVLVPKPS